MLDVEPILIQQYHYHQTHLKMNQIDRVAEITHYFIYSPRHQRKFFSVEQDNNHKGTEDIVNVEANTLQRIKKETCPPIQPNQRTNKQRCIQATCKLS